MKIYDKKQKWINKTGWMGFKQLILNLMRYRSFTLASTNFKEFFPWFKLESSSKAKYD